ncbi:HK97 family phage prohead protease [Lactococcus paracarnosus]|uniref:HK97 family phage prohead protease n=1 Tax=Pseudolactococcus paracarnosus TaxID=2749962 RepID=UPI001FB93F95|nr:HK97 family phage prohead protease [Lactococcus paracarnosus]MCJ1998475.1 hypothetical protein [Lactococcus paracarnosus]
MKKLVENVVKLQLVKNEVDGSEASDFKIQAIVAHTDIINDNGFLLDGDVIEFKRDTYPFLFNHESSNLLGETKTHFDAEQKAYVSEITVYDSKQDIIKAIQNGVYDSVSIGYYIDDYEFQEDGDAIVVHHAVMNEVSLVSVGADSDAKLVANEFKEEKQAHILAQNKLKELKKSYE